MTIAIHPISIHQYIRDVHMNNGVIKYHKHTPIITVRSRFLLKNMKSNPFEYIRVARSDKYQMGIQESPTARADQTTP